jgi:REP element-mobilizing transposase RayT
LPLIVQSWKSFTAKWALSHNAELGLGIPKPIGSTKNQFWMREYWDRYIRDEKHFHAVVNYIHNNPVKAGFCQEASAWPWSSAAGNAKPQLGKGRSPV